MSLSICLLTGAPAARIAAILEPLRPYADEVIIAADSRVGEETLAGYGALADKLFSVEFVQVERHLGWLCAQCGGDWILRLDGDEVPSRAFVRRLPELLASREAQQFWIARAWLYPDGGHVLAEMPWSEDFVGRLTRNDGTLRLSGMLHTHADPVVPCEYVEEPLYHLDLLSERQARLDKVVCYEVARPGLRAPAGGGLNESYYLPELRSHELALRPVPEEDGLGIARALAASLEPAPRPARGATAAVVSLEEMDERWVRRGVDADAYRAEIEPYAPSLSLAPGEQRRVLIDVRNQGTATWPCSLDGHPSIRLSYRWLNRDRSVRVSEGARTPFARVVRPGERVLTPLHVDAPCDEGEYLLEVDVVHEHERWFGCECRTPARVKAPRELAPHGTRLRESPLHAPGPGAAEGVRIPRVIHRVWLGEGEMPGEQVRFGETFAHHHPGWTMRLWRDADLASLNLGADELHRARSPSELSDVVRYEVLSRLGGIYVDTDVECRRSLVPLLDGVEAFAGLEAPGRVGTAILGSTPGHPAFARAARMARETMGSGESSADATGPYFLSLILEQERGVALFGAHLLYPYSWDEPERREDEFPDAYTVHHWAQSWRT